MDKTVRLFFPQKVPAIAGIGGKIQVLFDVKKVQKCYPTRFLDLFSKPYLTYRLLIPQLNYRS
ncbi:MAG: hypothetical protein EWV89_01345 [Microcystis wesenbergii Mw_QC_B_20070930_S4]|nr:MAG: hypothetical protein EWV74_00595 [Microcystis wesenbergii Mw_QC_S_20081001_S30]TRV17936.1 MAG: hypothetical protein EWV89_01345 [Microcystis wesenbergii Mw_QC_B_20070930_S4]